MHATRQNPGGDCRGVTIRCTWWRRFPCCREASGPGPVSQGWYPGDVTRMRYPVTGERLVQHARGVVVAVIGSGLPGCGHAESETSFAPQRAPAYRPGDDRSTRDLIGKERVDLLATSQSSGTWLLLQAVIA